MADSKASGIPAGFTLRHTLRGHAGVINRIAWSPHGNMLASPSKDGTIRLWDIQTGKLLQTLNGRTNRVWSVAWSPDGEVLASGGEDKTIRLWNTQTGQLARSLTGYINRVNSVTWSPDGKVLASGGEDKIIRLWNTQTGQQLRSLTGHTDRIYSIAWSPDGKVLASGGEDTIIRLWNIQTGQQLRSLTGHTERIWCVAWSPDGKALASGGEDKTLRFWDAQTGQSIHFLEGHTNFISNISFSHDSRLMASKSCDGTVRIWRVGRWETIGILSEPTPGFLTTGLAFHPRASVLATLGEEDTVIRIWDLNIDTLLEADPTTLSVHYTNAKVVLVGDSGVGKSGLGLVLTSQPFTPTESTHGRKVWIFDSYRADLGRKRKENRETLLWDLAGQTGYRIVHQLHLNDVAIALLVFDSHSETDPFAGVDHWVRALNMAQKVQGDGAIPMKKFLVAARTDRSGRSVSRERIDTLVESWGIDGYFETSAKEGLHVAELGEAIKKAINWDKLPKVTSTELFQRIKAFLVTEIKANRPLLSTTHELYRALLRAEKDLVNSENLYAQFETCIGRVESQGLIRRLSFGNLVLLRPELLDAYASALVNSMRDEPDGLGSILEEKVKTCDFDMPKDERIADREQEKLLLIAMVEDMLRYEIALREQSDDGAYLVFPSQSTRTNPDLPNPEGKAVIFRFEGPIQNIYATLAVRLSHSGLFVKKDLWQNATTYTTRVGGVYGLFLKNMAEGLAELTLFFEQGAKEDIGFHFEEFVSVHLQRRALPGTIQRRRIFVCSDCGTPLSDLAVTRRKERGFNWINCPVCDRKVWLYDREERLVGTPDSKVSEMDLAADTQRDRAAAALVMQGKMATGDFDVFLCHNKKDKSLVKEMGEKLKEHGILPWLAEWELPPGRPWQPLLEKQIGKIKAAAVFVSKSRVTPWHQLELDAFLREFVKRGCPVIPVLLPGTRTVPELPIFLRGMTWVDFRKKDPDPMKQLIWGITGQRDKFD